MMSVLAGFTSHLRHDFLDPEIPRQHLDNNLGYVFPDQVGKNPPRSRQRRYAGDKFGSVRDLGMRVER